MIGLKNEFRSKALLKTSLIMSQNNLLFRAQKVANMIDGKSEQKAKALFNISEAQKANGQLDSALEIAESIDVFES